MLVGDLYAEGRERLLALARDLEPADAATPVPACPEWTVKDVYAHLAGVVADAMAGRLEGVATPPWTARHVADRADRSLAEVCAEWAGVAPAFEDVLRTLGDAADRRVVADQWTHERDIRGALDRPGARDLPVVSFLVGGIAAGLARAAAKDAPDLPAVGVIGSSGEWLIGTGDPVATVRASDYELARALMGRRTDAQVRAYDWDGDPTPHLPHLRVFDPPAADLVE